MSMSVVVLADKDKFSMSGECPHCRSKAVFMIVAGPYIEEYQVGFPSPTLRERLCAALRCQGCLNFILGIATRARGNQASFSYEMHYPLSKPNLSVAEEIPPEIASNFKEALRCRFVDAYNATGEMCRRALESSCNELTAPSGRLVDKIDWLAQQGIITGALKDVAHKIRLGGNYGAHAPEDPMNAEPMTAEHADALIEFMRDYFQHVYVMPKKLQRYDFTKKGMSKQPPTPTP